jgi:hypothetical protein
MSLAVFALIASPLLAFLGVLLGHRTTRRGALELDRWRKREEAMRLLRWAVELATDPASARADIGIGIAVLDQLLLAPILDEEDRSLVAAVPRTVARGAIVDPTRGRPP